MNVHDEILESALGSPRALDDPRVREHLAGCAACRERLDELRRLSRGLDGLAAEEREDLARAKAADAREGLDPAFEAMLDRHRVRGPRTVSRASPASRRVGLAVALAAAVVLLLFGRQLAVHEPGGAAAPDPYLGDVPSIELVVLERSRLEWRFDGLPAGGYYRLTIADGNDPSIVPVDRQQVRSNAWTPSAALPPVALPDTFVVRIEARDANNELVGLLPEARYP